MNLFSAMSAGPHNLLIISLNDLNYFCRVWFLKPVPNQVYLVVNFIHSDESYFQEGMRSTAYLLLYSFTNMLCRYYIFSRLYMLDSVLCITHPS